jgi:hypothetical protein
MACVAWLLQNNHNFHDTIVDILEAIANSSNGLIELHVAFRYWKACVAWLLQKQPLPASWGRCQTNNRFIEL